MKVVHKGFLIVALPLILELLVLIFFGILLDATSKEHALASRNRHLSITAARASYAELATVDLFLKTFHSRDVSYQDDIDRSIERIESLTKTLRKLRPSSSELMISRNEFIKVTESNVKVMRKIQAISQEGFTLDSLRRLKIIESKAVSGLQHLTERFRYFYIQLNHKTEAEERAMKDLATLQFAGVGVTFALTILLGIYLFIYFRREFVRPIYQIRKNIEAFAEKRALASLLPGTDEIAQFDQAFHKMANELTVASAREKSLFDNSSDIIGLIDVNFNFVKVNHALQRLCNYVSNEIQGEPVFSILTDKSANDARRLFQESKKHESYELELELLCSNGERIESLWSAVWMETLQQWCFVASDISEEKKLARLKEEFLKLIANDFQRPLEAISSQYAELKAGSFGRLPDDAIARVQTAIATLSRMVSLVGELLQLERVNSATSAPQRNVCYVKDALDSAASDLSALAGDKQITIAINCATELKWNVDQSSMIRVLVNLVSNAIKYSPNNSAIIIEAKSYEGNYSEENNSNESSLDAERFSQGDLHASSSDSGVLIRVIDQGAGIPAESIDTLFKSYSQLSAADGARGRGTGLGLAICQKLIEQHGGKIGVYSKEGAGSTFWINLPQLSSESRSAQIKSEIAESGTKESITPESPTSESTTSKGAGQAESTNVLLGNLGLWKKAAILIGLPLIFQIAFTAVMLYLTVQSSMELGKQLREQRVINSALYLTSEFYYSTVVRSEGTGYIESGKTEQALENLPGRLLALSTSADGDKLASQFVPEITTLIQKELPEVRATEKHGERLAVALVKIQNAIGQKMEKMLDAVELRNKLSPEALSTLRTQQSQLIIVALLVNISAALLLALFFGNDVSKRILILAENTHRFAKQLELLPVMSGTDEITQLDYALHSMAEKLNQAHARESAFLRNSSNLICSFDTNYNFTTVNLALEFFTHTPAIKLLNTSIMTLLHEDDKELFAAALNRARTATEPMHFEARLTDQSMYFQWSLLWSKVEQSYFCVAHDISKRKDLERMRKEFVAVISHDLRSPITTISGTTKLLLHEAFGPIPDESRKVLDQIMLQCSQIIELVNDLLDLEKFEAKQMQLTQESIAIHQEILHEYGNRASTEISSSLPEAYSLTVDKARFLLALKGILEEVEALQSAHILLQLDENKTIKEFTLTINCSACQNLAALASILAKLSGKIGNIAEEETVASSSRLKLPLAMRIIEAHNGKITATINENNLVLEIKLPAAQPVLDLEMPARKV